MDNIENLPGSPTAYRLCNGKASGLDGVTIDKYGTHFQIQFFNKKMLKHEQELVEMVKKRFLPEFIAVKYRFEGSGLMKAVFGSDSKTVVEENGCKFAVDLMDTLNPGLFLDMRDARQVFGTLCEGKPVLNLFAYTCSFGVYAKKNGASSVVNVDISKKNLNRGRENFALNGLDGDFFCGSSEEYVDWAVKKGKKFGAIVIDPPSFARNGKKTFSVAKDFEPLAAKAVSLLEVNGILLLATNYSEWDGEALRKMARRIRCRILKSGTQGKDFPGAGQSKESSMVWVIAKLISVYSLVAH
ncbi:MAG: class I SAM-dependent methyltransferase [Fibromonadales bacterium]|nr:class I SAM-dependent methyltransferase [Fibromonadales bacterium]